MRAKSLRLTNFRNYETLDLRLSPNINVFLGENAQGKT
ncbi:AAA family ATPase, partial [uncultured Selenomonas sp.]